jgi:hypothetical protein
VSFAAITLCVAYQRVFIVYCCRLRPETFGYTLVSSSLLCKTVKIKIYINIILHFLLYECETWSLTMREEHNNRFRVIKNGVLRRIYRPKRDEVAGG